MNRTDVKGRGGRDIYRRDWMTEPSYIPDGKRNRLDSGLQGVGADANDPVDEAGMLDFQAKWNAVKGIIWDFEETVGRKIINKLAILREMNQKVVERGDMALASILNESIVQVETDLDSYWQVKEILDEWRDAWYSVAGTLGLAGVSGLDRRMPSVGGLGEPFSISVTIAMITAITVAATVGMALYQEYALQTYVLDQLASDNLTAEARASLEQVAAETESGGIIENVTDTIQTVIQLAMLGALAFFGYKAYQSA